MSAYKRKDGFYRKAKAEGYRSRAAYKLLELDRRFGLLSRGARVVDLGCAPGGWLQVAAAKVGRKGRVVGIDRLPVEDLELANAVVLSGDITNPDAIERIRQALAAPADLVLSDVAPDTSGVASADHARSIELVELAFETACALLAPDGALCAKVFDGPDLDALVATIKTRFKKLRRVRPEATRKGSRELYLVCSA